ncbi:uncharacterized protein MICPUCDRAFT_64013 [Micromonas pusilla CCMP1545]|uniref:Predicted protein n=1 Tax=Micromonas pusilla (strain CCMP1545) TaxID=564608 RepID=C1MJK6_MICPC|nr:uncharacterized protein MICPUCDRAFT_64013 [Micromonas pusilla CCMP1545]EEH59212.1 predicted protein [Micromonas pusilla CCMP1545]|eukprot:XP_003055836.1 predicted protein [Micromonas pusilla CCMP1545]
MTERAYARLGGAQLGVASANEDGGGDGSLEEERERRATTREGGGGGGGGSGAGRGPAAAAASADGRAAAARAGAQRECAALLVRCAKDLEEDAGEDAGWRRDALARLARALTDGGGGGDDENQNLVDDQNQNQNQKSLRIGVHHANAVVWEPVQNGPSAAAADVARVAAIRLRPRRRRDEDARRDGADARGRSMARAFAGRVVVVVDAHADGVQSRQRRLHRRGVEARDVPAVGTPAAVSGGGGGGVGGDDARVSTR